jgi:hypothetical protein
MKLVRENEDEVLFDRRKGDRRRSHERVPNERRHGERRLRDITTDLQKSGWVLVRPSLRRSAQRGTT